MFGLMRSGMLALLVAALAVSAMPSSADAQMAGKAIDARRAIMKSNGKNFGVGWKTNGWVKVPKLTFKTSCKMKRP